MKITDMIFQYPTYSISGRDGICRVRTFIGTEGQINVLLTDLGRKNTFASVTNSVENICGSLIEKGVVPKQSNFIEHYEGDIFKRDSFDLISFDKSGQPSWKSIKKPEVLELLGCSNKEFQTSTLKNKRLLSEIEKIRNGIDPFLDLPYSEDPEIINRRLEIEAQKISKKTIVNLIESGSKEQDLASVLKSDLSLFAEIYAHPQTS